MKKWGLGLIAAFAVVLSLAGCGSKSSESANKTIRVGSMASDVEIWQHIAKSKEAKAAGLKLKVVSFDDGVQLNQSTLDGDVDVNAFQSYAYFEAFNKQSKNGQEVAIGTTYLEPMGIYSEKHQSLKAIPDGATVIVANDAANQARGLQLLAKAGLITLPKDFDSFGKISDIKTNPHHLKFKAVQDNTIPRMLKDADYGLLANTVAYQAHLNVLTDSLYHERVDQSTRKNVNILATAAKNKGNKQYRKLITVYHKPGIQKWLKKKFGGTKVDVQKPISYLEN
ncbi:MAG: MetQ/NlpA family ABC transporter substrate-binding protein [Lactobacillus sp.]|jgi:D-methionine transport system substrate-binding protein|nr:MetQ/NlpA family ABC transporter substrate-binding protein [Lactobacillus sp.]MCI2032394.1 MetQ/NlpA family ABC transporter substrate-binding protein [Lactobacillus sp.]